jgi:hypothetical protein
MIHFSALRHAAVPAVWAAAEDASSRGDIYNILWVLVFGFATLNILGLVARKFEPTQRNRLTFGESLAIMVVVVSVILLTWELLYWFKVLPIKLKP